MNIKSFPLQRTHWLGYLLKSQKGATPGAWSDVLGCEGANLTFEGMLDGDSIQIWGANTVDMPKPGQGVALGKPITQNGLLSLKGGYRWYKASLDTEAKENPVTVQFLGQN